MVEDLPQHYNDAHCRFQDVSCFIIFHKLVKKNLQRYIFKLYVTESLLNYSSFAAHKSLKQKAYFVAFFERTSVIYTEETFTLLILSLTDDQ